MNDTSEIKYQQILAEFCVNLQRYLSGILSRDKVPIIITMSRKMARIMEWLQISGMANIPRNAVVTSEYALPLCMDKLMDKYNGNVEALITDDIINTGRSVESVAACVMFYTKQKPKVLPLVSRKSDGNFEYCEMLVSNVIYGNNIIDYCIERNVENILSVGLPLDMEFPCMEIKMSKGWNKGLDVEDMLKGAFPQCSVYGVSHNIKRKDSYVTITNYSVLFDKNKNNMYVSSDFSKLRFFIGDDRLTIVAYSPRTIDESTPIREKIFKDNQLQKLWNVIIDGSNNDFQAENQEIIKSVYKNKSLSEVVMLNYLYSFAFLKYNIKNISNMLNGVGIAMQCSIDSRSLMLLVSSVKSGDIADMLNSVLYSDCNVDLDFDNLVFPLEENEVSVDCKESYETNNTLRLFKCATVEEGVSVIFRNQSKFLLNGKYAYESFSSLMNKLALHITSDDMLEKIHRCVDFMIDDASVTPTYVAKKVNGQTFWKRMFSAGDNTLLIDRLSSMIKYVFESYLEVCHKQSVERKEFSTVLSMALAYDMERLGLNNGKLSVRNEITFSYPTFDNIDSIDILKYVCDNGYIGITDVKGIEYCQATANDSLYSRFLLDSKEKQYIWSLLYFIWKYSRHEIFNLRYVMLNFSVEIYKCFADKIRISLLKRISEIDANDSNIYITMYDLADVQMRNQQANYVMLKTELMSLDESEEDTVKDIWKGVLRKCPDDYDEEYLAVYERFNVVLLMTLAFVDKFIFSDKENAEDTCKFIDENGFDVSPFINIIRESSNHRKNIPVVVSTFVQTVNNILS